LTETIDNIITIYHELFSVKFLHEGYPGGSRSAISSDLYINPDKQTNELFINHHIRYRFFDDVLVCFIECDLFAPPAIKPKIPHIPFIDKVQIRFNLKASQRFLNKTDVIAAGARQVYLFDNKLNAGVDKFICQHTDGVNNDDLKDISGIDIAPDEKCFAVVDIYDHDIATDYAVFNSDGTLIDEKDYDANPHVVDGIPLQFQIKFKSKI